MIIQDQFLLMMKMMRITQKVLEANPEPDQQPAQQQQQQKQQQLQLHQLQQQQQQELHRQPTRPDTESQ